MGEGSNDQTGGVDQDEVMMEDREENELQSPTSYVEGDEDQNMAEDRGEGPPQSPTSFVEEDEGGELQLGARCVPAICPGQEVDEYTYVSYDSSGASLPADS